MSFDYPKFNKQRSIGSKGEAYIANFVQSELGCIYRPVHQEHDFGIDGYVDIVDGSKVTGRTLAVQIKCGDSYLKKSSNGCYRYIGENKHLNFYLNQHFPVILIVLSEDCHDGYWVEFQPSKTTNTNGSSTWQIEIPGHNLLNADVLQKWKKIAGEAEDYSEGITQSWALNNILDGIKNGALIVHRESVERMEFDGVWDTIERLSKDRASLLEKRNSLDIMIHGYDDDEREAYEIPEIRAWYKESLNQGIPWFYFLADTMDNMSLKVLMFSVCEINTERVKGKVKLSLAKLNDLEEFMSINLHNLNVFAEENNIPEEILKSVSERVAKGLFPS